MRPLAPAKGWDEQLDKGAVTSTAPSAEALRVNGVDLAWSERGSGLEGASALVLCHGFTGSSFDFSLEVDALAVDRRVITLDQRGHGASTRTGHLDGYTVEQLVRDLTAFLEAVGDGPVDLLGHSMGGRVVMGVVLARPDLVRSLILMDTSAWSFLPPDEDIRTLVHGFMDRFDPAGGMPATLSLGGPEDVLIEAHTAAEWRTREGGHLRRHGRLRRQGPRERADGRRRRE